MKWLRNLLIAAALLLPVPALAIVNNPQTMSDGNITVGANTSSVVINQIFTAARTVTLPYAGVTTVGQSGAVTYYQNSITIYDSVGAISASNTLTLTVQSGDTINGSTTFVVSTSRAIVTLTPVGGSSWFATVTSASTGLNFTIAGTAGNIAATGTCTITSTGTCTLDLAAARKTRPTQQKLTSGTDQTYTTPANVLWIKISMVGGGAGGGGGGTTGGNGAVGNPTCWNTSGTACSSPVFQAGGGAIGFASGASGGGAGGTISGSGTCTILGAAGGAGGGSGAFATQGGGGAGGNSALASGGGSGSTAGVVGGNGVANSGGGGGGGGNNNGTASGSGGGSGATCITTINNPAATYTYTIGATATAGTAGTNGSAGGSGGSGYIVVEEFYN